MTTITRITGTHGTGYTGKRLLRGTQQWAAVVEGRLRRTPLYQRSTRTQQQAWCAAIKRKALQRQSSVAQLVPLPAPSTARRTVAPVQAPKVHRCAHCDTVTTLQGGLCGPCHGPVVTLPLLYTPAPVDVPTVTGHHAWIPVVSHMLDNMHCDVCEGTLVSPTGSRCLHCVPPTLLEGGPVVTRVPTPLPPVTAPVQAPAPTPVVPVTSPVVKPAKTPKAPTPKAAPAYPHRVVGRTGDQWAALDAARLQGELDDAKPAPVATTPPVTQPEAAKAIPTSLPGWATGCTCYECLTAEVVDTANVVETVVHTVVEPTPVVKTPALLKGLPVSDPSKRGDQCTEYPWYWCATDATNERCKPQLTAWRTLRDARLTALRAQDLTLSMSYWGALDVAWKALKAAYNAA